MRAIEGRARSARSGARRAAARKICSAAAVSRARRTLPWKITAAAERCRCSRGGPLSRWWIAVGRSKPWTLCADKGDVEEHPGSPCDGRHRPPPPRLCHGRCASRRRAAQKSQEQMGDFAQECMKKFMPYYEGAFGCRISCGKILTKVGGAGFRGGRNGNADAVLPPVAPAAPALRLRRRTRRAVAASIAHSSPLAVPATTHGKTMK